MTASKMLTAATDYLARGWSVIPIRPRSKLPVVRWEAYQHRLASEEEITDWFRRWPEMNIAIVSGSISGLAVLDVDPRHRGDESLRRLEEVHGQLAETIAAETGGGGLHLYFRLPARALHNRAGLADGIDLRAEGGMVVAPPSVHPSGRPYRWRPGRGPSEQSLAAMADWVLRLALGGPEGQAHTVSHWRDLTRTGVVEGERNSSLASLAGYLLWHGLDAEVVLELLLSWNRIRCRPPLIDDEVASVVASIARLHAGRGG